MSTQRRLIYIAGAIFLIVVITMMIWSGGEQTASTVSVEETSLSVSIRGEGKTRLVDSYVIAAPVNGQLKRAGLTEGSTVEQGALLFRIEPLQTSEQAGRVAEANLQAAVARAAQADVLVSDAQAAMEQSEINLKRVKSLSEDGIVTPEQLETAILAEKTAKNGLESAQNMKQAARADMAAAEAMVVASSQKRTQLATSVRAPVGGTVLQIFQRTDTAVMAGTPIMEIGNTRLMELVVDVLSEDAVQIQPGNSVEVSGWGGETLSGIVRLIEPSAFTKFSALGVEEQRVNVLIDFDSIPESMGVGYRVEAAIIISENPNVLSIPVSAVFKEGETWFTYAVVDDRVEKRTIRIGVRSDDAIEVVEGLTNSEEVVIYPSASIADGVRIKR